MQVLGDTRGRRKPPIPASNNHAPCSCYDKSVHKSGKLFADPPSRRGSAHDGA
jgi:hypothetical protein